MVVGGGALWRQGVDGERSEGFRVCMYSGISSPNDTVVQTAHPPPLHPHLFHTASHQVVRVVDGLLPSGAPVDPVAVDIGAVTVQMVNVRSAAGASDPLPLPPAGLLVRGTWGTPSAPDLVSATAVNSGGAAGLGSGDAVALVGAGAGREGQRCCGGDSFHPTPTPPPVLRLACSARLLAERDEVVCVCFLCLV